MLYYTQKVKFLLLFKQLPFNFVTTHQIFTIIRRRRIYYLLNSNKFSI